MTYRQLNIKKVLITGGTLDHRVDSQLLRETGGEKVTLLALDEAGRVKIKLSIHWFMVLKLNLFLFFLSQVFCWRSSGSSVRQCRWAYARQVFMSDIALSKNGLMFVTHDGEAFNGSWAGEYKKFEEKKGIHLLELCLSLKM